MLLCAPAEVRVKQQPRDTWWEDHSGPEEASGPEQYARMGEVARECVVSPRVTAGERVLVHLSETSQCGSGHCLHIRGACGQACLLPQRPWACPSISEPQVPQLCREGAHRKYLAPK